MNFWTELLSNRILLCCVLSWVCAQVIKTFTYAWINHGFNWSRITGDGGMPSSHSATVTALAVGSCCVYGPGSFEFAVTVILAFIVMHDAMGVRRETGKQTVAIKEIAELLEALGQDVTNEENLKELVGHTFLQVLAGAVLGACVALILCL